MDVKNAFLTIFTPFYSSFFWILYGFFAILNGLAWLYEKLSAVYVNYGKNDNEVDFDLMKRLLKILDKVPEHVGIVVGEENINLENIATIILNCSALNVKFMTVYDADGVIKKQEKLLLEYIKQKKRKLAKKNDFIEEKQLNGQNNNNPSSGMAEIRIKVLDYQDGKNEIVNVCQNVVDNSNGPNTEDLTVENVNKLFDNKNFPDPQLVLCYGTHYSVLGYLPWHIHLSEIHMHQSLNYMIRQNLIKSFKKYAKCEQRFGA